MRRKHLSQGDVAERAHISQATVSRALRGEVERQSDARTRLFNYIQEELKVEMISEGKTKVIEAFESIWDGSEAHATAIANIIKACDGLIPVKSEGGDR